MSLKVDFLVHVIGKEYSKDSLPWLFSVDIIGDGLLLIFDAISGYLPINL